MRKVALLLIFLLLLSSFSFSAETKITPSEVLSWAISVKDGTWTVKALSLAGGQQGAEAMSWVVDPTGKIISTTAGEVDKSCNGCFSVGHLLLDPVSGLTSTAMQEASKNSKDITALSQAFTMQQQVKQLLDTSPIPVKSAELVYDVNKDKSGNAAPTVTQMSPVEVGNLQDPIKVFDLYKSMDISNLQNAYVGVTESTLVLKPSTSQNIESRAKFVFTSQDKENQVQGDLKAGYIDLNLKKDSPTKDMVTNAELKAGDKGISAELNGNNPINVPKDVSLKESGTTCIEDKTQNTKQCTTSVTIEAPFKQQVTGGPQGTVDVKEKYDMEMCGQKFSVLSGTKMNVDMIKEGDSQRCVLKPGSQIMYSNDKAFNGASGTGQQLVFDNMKITTDPQKYDQQEGSIKWDGKTLEGTVKEVEFKDGTKISVGGETQRKTQVTDQMKVSLDADGNFVSASINSKERPVYLYNNGVNLFPDGFKTKDTFFTVKPVTITNEPVIKEYMNKAVELYREIFKVEDGNGQ